MQIIAQGYASYGIEGTGINKIIACGMQKVLRVPRMYASEKGWEPLI